MKNKIFAGFFLLGLVALCFSSCDNNDIGKQRERELERLDLFLKKNNITTKPTASGLYYMETEKGTGDTIKVGDRVQILYRMWRIVADGDSSDVVDYNIDALGRWYEPLEFTVTPPSASSVIEGINEAVKMMQKGTRANLIIPSELGYGQNGSYSIPGFATLLYDIRIYKVYPAK